MVLSAGLDLPMAAVRDQLSSALDLVVQVARTGEGRRSVVAVAEVIDPPSRRTTRAAPRRPDRPPRPPAPRSPSSGRAAARPGVVHVTAQVRRRGGRGPRPGVHPPRARRDCPTPTAAGGTVRLCRAAMVDALSTGRCPSRAPTTPRPAAARRPRSARRRLSRAGDAVGPALVEAGRRGRRPPRHRAPSASPALDRARRPGRRRAGACGRRRRTRPPTCGWWRRPSRSAPAPAARWRERSTAWRPRSGSATSSGPRCGRWRPRPGLRRGPGRRTAGLRAPRRHGRADAIGFLLTPPVAGVPRRRHRPRRRRGALDGAHHPEAG